MLFQEDTVGEIQRRRPTRRWVIEAASKPVVMKIRDRNVAARHSNVQHVELGLEGIAPVEAPVTRDTIERGLTDTDCFFMPLPLANATRGVIVRLRLHGHRTGLDEHRRESDQDDCCDAAGLPTQAPDKSRSFTHKKHLMALPHRTL